MTTETEVSRATWRRGKAAELRVVAERTSEMEVSPATWKAVKLRVVAERTAETEVSPATWWRGKAVEVREVAKRTADPVLRRRLFDLADRWELDVLDAGGATRVR
jgi:hypothetical protein